MAENNTLDEWSDGEDDWVWDINENNMLGEWSDGEDDMIRGVDSDLWEWSDPEADDIIRNMNVDDSEWNDPEADDIIRNMNADDSNLSGWSDPQTDAVIGDIQTGRGEKRKSDEPLLPEKDFYEMESVTKHHSKKFGLTATDHIIRFNTVLSELDLIESYERTPSNLPTHIERCNPGYERERPGTVRVTFRSTGHTYLNTFHTLSPTYNRTGVLPNRTCYTIEPGLQVKRYGNGRHNTR